MNEQWCSEEELGRRVEARRAAEGERPQVRCRRCKKAIPETRRRSARYCSDVCRVKDENARSTALRAEVRHAWRSIKAPTHCGCGAELDNTPTRPSKIRTRCRRCYMREYMRKRRAS